MEEKKEKREKRKIRRTIKGGKEARRRELEPRD